MSFIQPPFWGRERTQRSAPHAVSTLVPPPPPPLLTVDQGKLRAGLDWIAGDPRDALMAEYIAAATVKVEQDTGLALSSQTRDVYYDALPFDRTPIVLPAQCRPLQSVTSITYTDLAGTPQTVDPAIYIVDLVSGRLGLSVAGFWPVDVRYFQPWVIRLVAGYSDPLLIPPPLLHAIGLLTAHFATAGRDIAEIVRGTATEMPFGYWDALAPYQIVSLA